MFSLHLPQGCDQALIEVAMAATDYMDRTYGGAGVRRGLFTKVICV